MRTVKSGLRGLRTLEKVAHTRKVVVGLTGNAAFSAPTPSMAVVTTACDNLETAYNEALGGSTAQREVRWQREKELDTLVAQLCLYVNTAAAGDRAVAATSNFPLIKVPQSFGPLPAPQNAHARLTEFTGDVDLKWDSVDGSRYYHVYMTEGDPSVATGWTLLGISSRTQFIASNLESGKLYTFRITAIGTEGEGAASDVVQKRAA